MSLEASAPWTIFERQSVSHAVVVLNTPINFDQNIARRIVDIWNSALLRITVDGGTDRWLEWVNKIMSSFSSTTAAVKSPHMITGDLDSIQADTLEYFRSKPEECQVILTMDQCQTDFTKALLELKEYQVLHALEIPNVLVLCDMSGRFDQTISSISTLYKAQEFLESKVYLLSSTSLTWLLSPGRQHHISIPRNLREEKKCCGLLPIGGKCKVKTSGLRWNLNNDILEFGKLVSSSNTYDETKDTVIIETDNLLTWTMEIDSYLSHVSNTNSNTQCANKL